MNRLCGLAAVALVALAAGPALARPRPPAGFAPALPQPPRPAAANGAIFDPAVGYAALVEGRRARAVGDPLTIVLVESTVSGKSAGSRSARSGGFSVTPPGAGPLSFLKPDALRASGQGSFDGRGNATQESTLAGQVGVTIAEVRPNGTALVRGEKRLLLSQGQEWVQFSGIVRLGDIDGENRISSSQVADARIEYAGNGAVQRASREGWLSRFFTIVSPF